MDDDQPPAKSTGVDYRQVSFLLLAAIALVVAALLAPGLVAEPGSGDGGTGDDDGIGDSTTVDTSENDGEGDPDSFDWTDLLEWLGFADSEPVPPDEPTCTIYVHGEPTPGDEHTVAVEYREEPLEDAQVWFEDRPIGTTDDRGEVTGEVPYVEELTIRVETEDDVECLAVESGPSITLEESATRGAASAASLKMSAGETPSTLATSPVVSQSIPQNATVEYAVDGDVELAVDGVPDPGSTLTVEATIDGVPMTAADVTVDGDDVGETDDKGRETVTVPDDGTERLEVAVSRGDFTGETTLEVRLLETRLTPEGIAPIPGSEGVVVAERAGEPIADADVTIDGDDVGETDAAGTTSVSIPRDPTAPVTVRTADQTARTTLLEAYGLSAVAIALLVGVVAGGTYRTHGTRGPVTTVAVATGLLAVLVVEAFVGPLAGLVAFGALVVVGLAGAAYRSERTISVDRSVPAKHGRGLLEGLLRWAFSIATRLEALLERALRALRGGTVWLASLARSTRKLPRRGIGWLASIPGKLVAVLDRAVETAARVRSAGAVQRLAAVVGLAVVSGSGYAVAGTRGGVVALLAGAVALLGVHHHRRSASDEDQDPPSSNATDGHDRGERVVRRERNNSSEGPRPVATVWRSFARQVAPVQWRTRAPVEIERRAIDRGYPADPVGELTALFRASEYGSGTETRADRERAAKALEAISDARASQSDGDDGTEPEFDAETLEHPPADRATGDGPTRGGDQP